MLVVSLRRLRPMHLMIHLGGQAAACPITAHHGELRFSGSSAIFVEVLTHMHAPTQVPVAFQPVTRGEKAQCTRT